MSRIPKFLFPLAVVAGASLLAGCGSSSSTSEPSAFESSQQGSATEGASHEAGALDRSSPMELTVRNEYGPGIQFADPTGQASYGKFAPLEVGAQRTMASLAPRFQIKAEEQVRGKIKSTGVDNVIAKPGFDDDLVLDFNSGIPKNSARLSIPQGQSRQWFSDTTRLRYVATRSENDGKTKRVLITIR